MSGVYVCSNGFQNGGHIGKNHIKRKDLAGVIDKKDIVLRPQKVFLETVALSEAALEEVALHSTLETALWNGDNDAGRGIIVPEKILAADAAMDEGLSTVEELRYSDCTGEPFAPGKGCGHLSEAFQIKLDGTGHRRSLR